MPRADLVPEIQRFGSVQTSALADSMNLLGKVYFTGVAREARDAMAFDRLPALDAGESEDEREEFGSNRP
jgi:hypothetical protein